MRCVTLDLLGYITGRKLTEAESRRPGFRRPWLRKGIRFAICEGGKTVGAGLVTEVA
jgi:hypothetical protein